MGQRHQIYVALPYQFKQWKDWKEKEKVDGHVIALHHQWLYGVSAGQQLLQFLQFAKAGVDNDDMYRIFGPKGYHNDAQQVAAMLYSLTLSEGYYHYVSVESKKLADNPLFGDNNDGITVIDLRDEQPRYAMMFIGARATEAPQFVALNGLQYMETYYGDQKLLEPDGYFVTHEEKLRAMQKKMTTVWEKLQHFDTLTTEEVMRLFPTMAKEIKNSVAKSNSEEE